MALEQESGRQGRSGSAPEKGALAAALSDALLLPSLVHGLSTARHSISELLDVLGTFVGAIASDYKGSGAQRTSVQLTQVQLCSFGADSMLLKAALRFNMVHPNALKHVPASTALFRQ